MTKDDGKFLANLLEQHNFSEPDPGDDSEWTKNIPMFSTEVGIDNVDKYFLAKARAEVEVVKKHFMLRVFGAQEAGTRQRHVPASLAPSTIMNKFLDDHFLVLIRSQMNKHIKGNRGEPFSTEEVILFIRVQLYLSVFGCSPSLFFDIHLSNIRIVGYVTSSVHRCITCSWEVIVDVL
jgi:hypothetical protein